MKILETKTLVIPEIKVIKFARFTDHRGYFSEHFRCSDLSKHLNLDIVQANESYSKKNTVRGLHFQWNPYMGKLVRTVHGHMIDMVLDIRKDSKTSGRIIMYDMPSNPEDKYQEWIWVPPGFAHGNFFLKETTIEYFCTGEYSQNCEAGISPLSPDINWELCDKKCKEKFDSIKDMIISDKDKNGLNLADWYKNTNSEVFTMEKTNV